MKPQVFTSGNLGKDAKVTTFQNNRSVIEFDLATNTFYKDNEGKNQQITSWYSCKKFVKDLNESFVEKFKKGVSITVAGFLDYDEYTPEDKTQKVKSYYIDIKNIDFH